MRKKIDNKQMLFEMMQKINPDFTGKQFINESVQDVLWNFQNKPLLGGYFMDVIEDLGAGRVIINIAKTPTQQGQKSLDVDKLGQAIYWVDDKQWTFDNLNTPSSQDSQIMQTIAGKIDGEVTRGRNFQAQQQKLQ